MSLLVDLLRGLAGVAGRVGPGGMLAVAVLAVVVGVLAWAADKAARALDAALRAWTRLPLWARQVAVVLAGLQALRSAPPKWLGAAAMCLALAWWAVGQHQAKLFDRRDAAAGLTPRPMADLPAWHSHLRWVRERAERSRIDSAARRLPGNKRTSRPTRSVRSEGGGRTRAVLPAPPGTVPEAFAEALRNGAADGALFDALGRVARVHEARVLPDGGVEAVIDGPLRETPGPADDLSRADWWDGLVGRPVTPAEMFAAGVDIGRYADGSRMVLPVPGWEGAHFLVGGSSHSGKSHTLHFLLAKLVRRFGPLVQPLILDPHMVGFGPWEPRAACVAYGSDSADLFLSRVEAEMERRLVVMLRGRLGAKWTPALADTLGPYLVIVIDELGSVLTSKETIGRLVALAQQVRKVGAGLVLAAQSPKAEVVTNLVKEQCPVRWCGRCESPEQTTTMLGDRSWGAHDPKVIPLRGHGVAFVRDGLQTRLGRTDGVTSEVLERVIAETAADRRDVPGIDRVIYPAKLAAALAAAGRSV